jgi:putative transposase
MQVVTELKNRGVTDIFIACVDGLKGFPEAIEAVYPQTQVQLCMFHMFRHALSYVSHPKELLALYLLRQHSHLSQVAM